MSSTIFYSWQSDTDPNTNHFFLKGCLTDALGILASGDELEEVIRGDELHLDHDTMGVFGDVEVLNTILTKIRKCDLFVADITVVAKTADGKQCPNPNVLLELGYAIDAAGSERTIKVMNEYYGSAVDGLPFDMAHKRFPVRYTLAPDTEPGEKKRIQKQVTKDLVEIIGGMLREAGLKRSPVPEFNGVEPVWKSSSFVPDGELGKYLHPALDTPLPILWGNGTQWFLRIIPHKKLANMTSAKLLSLLSPNELLPFGRNPSPSIMQNQWGAVVFEQRGSTDQVSKMTQLFETGELWGIERESDSSRGLNLLPFPYITQVFTAVLENYLSFIKERLLLEPPYMVIAGVSLIKDYVMGDMRLGYEGKGGLCPKIEVIDSSIIGALDSNSSEILEPFFQKLWEEFGLTGEWKS